MKWLHVYWDVKKWIILGIFLSIFLSCSCKKKDEADSSSVLVENAQGRPVDAFTHVGDLPTVFLFTKTDCPIANRYAPTCIDLYEKYSTKGVSFILVYPDPAEDHEMISHHLSSFQYPFSYLRDPDHRLVSEAKARVTPEATMYVRDQDGQVRQVYRGRIDDRYVSLGKGKVKASRNDLALALDAVLAGQPVETPVTEAVGCTIADFK